MRQWQCAKLFGLLLGFSLWSTLMIRCGIDYAQRKDNGKSDEGTQEYYDMRQVLLDKRKPPSKDEIVQSIERELPSMPLSFHITHENKRLRKNDTCALYPYLLNLKFHNDYWQIHTSADCIFYLFGAYYDNRPLEVQSKPVMRILTMINKHAPPLPPSYCQLWFDDVAEPSIVPVLKPAMMWHEDWGFEDDWVFPWLLTCQLPDEVSAKVPTTVSLVSEPCATSSNSLRVVHETVPANGRRGRFAVCSKGLYDPYEDRSVRMVEWLELMRLLGAEKVVIYDLGSHPNVSKVFRHYERSGFLEARRITLARGEPSLASFNTLSIQMHEMNHRMNQVLALNDCLYRLMYKYEYIAVKDTDEVIMPLGNLTSWADLVRIGEQLPHPSCRGYSAFCFRCVYFPSLPELPPFSQEVPAYLYMLQHVRRVQEHMPEGFATKCLHNTSIVIAVHNHYPLHWKSDYCQAGEVNVSVGQMQHYREPDDKETLKNLTIDKSNWRFREPLVNRTLSVLRELGFFPKVNATEWQRLQGTGEARQWQ